MTAEATAESMRRWAGPAVLGYGFRPLFLGAGAWAAAAMLVWVLALTGLVRLPTAFSPVDWHVHALLFGYVPAVVAGFLLTAVPNWTGRMPVVGWPLLGLVALWAAGRVAVTGSDGLAPALVAAVDLGFLAVLGAVIGREIVAGRNWRNLPVLAAVALLWLANLLFHLEAAAGGAAAGALGTRIAVAVTVFLIILIGGRIVPSFTRNWLVKQGEDRRPAPMGRRDGVALALGAGALGAWVVAPEAPASGASAIAAAAFHAVRLGRWAGWRTGREPLVAILHLAYLFVPLGFLAVGASILVPGLIAPGAALHAWTVGAIGAMTLAVMTRASLGHTGRALAADAWTDAIYASVLGAAFLRVAHGLAPGEAWLLHLSAALWFTAFGLFVVAYFGILTGPRLAPKRANRVA